MSFYDNFILPRLCHFAMRNRRLLPYRERVIGAAEGRVLEIGVGSGPNLTLYREPAHEIVVLDALERVPRIYYQSAFASRSLLASTISLTALSRLETKQNEKSGLTRAVDCYLTTNPNPLSMVVYPANTMNVTTTGAIAPACPP
jgi:hypothetical protein